LRPGAGPQARKHIDTLMPGYTHLQRAQPCGSPPPAGVRRDARARPRRLGDAARRGDVSPLGSGALAGTTLPIDRDRSPPRSASRG